MSFLISFARYVAIILAISIAGWLLTRLSLALAVNSIGKESLARNYFWLWLLASTIISMILALISFLFIGTSDPDEISHYEGSVIGSSVNLHSVTNGEASFKFRTFVILILSGAIETCLRMF